MVSDRPSEGHELICIKDHGALSYPSDDVSKILKTCKMVFKGIVSGDNFEEPKINQKTNLKLKLKTMVLRKLPTGRFRGLECDFHNEIVSEDLHSYQITKEIVDLFMKIRLLRYGH